MSIDPDEETEADVLAALGSLIIAWNQADNQVRRVIGFVISPNPADENLRDIVTAELGSVGLSSALRSLAASHVSEDFGKHLTHVARLHERLRDYRNYYAHGIIGIKSPPASLFVIHTISSKTFVKENYTREPASVIRDITEHIYALARYAEKVVTPAPWKGRREWPPMPPLPDRLEKPGWHRPAVLEDDD